MLYLVRFAKRKQKKKERIRFVKKNIGNEVFWSAFSFSLINSATSVK